MKKVRDALVGLLTGASVAMLLPIAAGCGAAPDGGPVGQTREAFTTTSEYYVGGWAGGLGDPWEYGNDTTDTLRCRTGDVAVGIFGRAGDWIDRIGLVCAPLNFDGTVGPSFARYDVGSYGGNGGGPFDIECPDNFAMVEIKGQADTYVESASIRCQKAPFSGVAATEFDPGISAGKIGGQPYVYPQVCTGKSVIEAMNVYHGQFVDALSVYCVFINNP